MATEPPECPVCLQFYDGASTIPRVLACGHSACESCLSKLPERFPLTIRCPACTQLVHFPSQGSSFLPKNIDLLSLSLSLLQTPNPNPNPNPSSLRIDAEFVPRSWSDEFYAAWRGWVLPSDGVSVEERGGFCEVSRGKASDESLPSRVSLVRVGCLGGLSGSGFEFGYVYRVLKCLGEMREGVRKEMELVLRGSSRRRRKMGRVCGVWGDLDDGSLYLVCEFMDDYSLGKVGNLSDDFRAFVMIGVELIEAMICLHSEDLVAGFCGVSYFGSDEFGHACVDMSQVLVTGRKIRKSFSEECSDSDRIEIHGGVVEAAMTDLLRDDIFVSPELVWKEGKKTGCSVGYKSDSWSMACLLLRLLIGKEFTEGFPVMTGENGSEHSELYARWVEKISSLLDAQLGSEFASVKDILLKCLIYDPESRPLLTDLRRLMREMIIKPQHDMTHLELAVDRDSNSRCIILGELCQLFKETPDNNDDLQGREAGDEADLGQVKVERVHENFLGGLAEGEVKYKDLQGHRDCITGIAVGGGFLFSSSFDKTIRLWSLQDFSHVHTFEGHEHKVMDVIYVDQEQPLCISGDSGGGIFVWGISTPFGKEPLKKWYDQKDWRYSGIHALCFSKNGYVYTGCGDKSIKAWLLQDGHLSCTMNGHKSAVSTLSICDEVLYSGSWDGTIRLWALSDHTPLTVLGEDVPGAVISVLSLAVDRHMLIAAYENGTVKVWRNDVFMKSMQLHEGAIFATQVEGKLLFSGGWDKTVNVQELSGDELHIDPIPIGSITCNSAVTVLLFWQGKLFIGCADRLLKVYY